jgi:hypothetical protein
MVQLNEPAAEKERRQNRDREIMVFIEAKKHSPSSRKGGTKGCVLHYKQGSSFMAGLIFFH